MQPKAASRQREYGLDWLRVIAFIILIGYHTGMYFVPWPWSVKNPDTASWLVWPMSFFHAWRLPLLFFISGAGACFSLGRRTAGQFARDRFRRLTIPLLFGLFVLCPPQTYVERICAGWHYASYWEFWGTIFTLVSYPKGNLTWQHLWFLPYILTFSILGLPLFALLRAPAGRDLTNGLARMCERPGVIYLLSIPNITAAVVLGPRWPVYNNLVSDWANFTASLLTFLWGFVICGNVRFLELIARRRREFLCVAALMTMVFYAVRLPYSLPGLTADQRFSVTAAIDSFFGMVMIFNLVGWSRTLLNRDGPALRYATKAVYPFYVIHQTITVLLGYAWIGWRLPFAIKFPLLFGGTVIGSWLTYVVVRRNATTRLLFGMKP